MTLVKSPYNFVPAPVKDQVFTPKWSKDVSHDVPFEDGESGEIEIEITAETPIFIRNGYKKPKEGERPTEEFSHFIDKNGQKQYFIPATSLKGMVRNVLEIMSFSRLNKNLVKDEIFTKRDRNNKKISYINSIHNLKPLNKYSSSQDLANTIFGYSANDDSLKGRVFFGHAFAKSETVKIKEKPESEILSSPKASYFPFYIEQFKKSGESYFTYDDDQATLRGYKRYPVRQKDINGNYDEKQKENINTWCSFKPIQKDAKFNGKIKFHNLKKQEIGALLSALTFHDNSNLCNHSLGGGKPFGYGRISISAKLKALEKDWKFEDCLQSFEQMMNDHISDWINSKSILELFAIAILSHNEQNLVYSTISEYQNYKKKAIDRIPKQIQNLESYSTNHSVKPKIKRLLAINPTNKKINDYPKGGGKVDAKVIGQEGMQMKVEVFLEGFQSKTYSVRYNDGLSYFGKNGIIELDLTFPNPKNKNQFNLNNPIKK